MENKKTKRKCKDWTVLIYAVGNNELEPEIWQSVQSLQGITSSVNVNIIIQIGRAEKQLVKLIRPGEEFFEGRDHWSGVRRYILDNGNLISIADLGKLNLADPGVLYDFISWSIDSYPARHFLLILSGHGYQFIGALTDYSQNRPYIMGIPGMSHILNMVSSQISKKIDILILDVCYFNYIEVINQFASNPDHAVQNIITFIRDGPLTGLSYPDLVHILQNNCKEKNIEKVIREIIRKLNSNLVALSLQHEKMKNIKKLINELARCYLKIKSKQTITLDDFFNKVEADDAWYNKIKKLQDMLFSIIIDYNNKLQKNINLIDIATRLPQDPAKVSYYYKLDFCRQNNWFDVLAPEFCKKLRSHISNTILEPVMLTPDVIKTNISAMNEHLGKDEVESFLKDIYEYKNW